MHTRHDENEHGENYMDDVKDLVSHFAQKEGSSENYKEGESSNDAINLCVL